MGQHGQRDFSHICLQGSGCHAFWGTDLGVVTLKEGQTFLSRNCSPSLESLGSIRPMYWVPQIECRLRESKEVESETLPAPEDT